eukprot:jgi/Mesen1/9296/ME000060S08737
MTGSQADETTVKVKMQHDVVNFLLQEKYDLTAFELLHELLEAGQQDAAGALQEYFSDKKLFPPEEMQQLQNFQVPEAQQLAVEKKESDLRAAALARELEEANEEAQSLRERIKKQSEAEAAASQEMQRSASSEAQRQEDLKNTQVAEDVNTARSSLHGEGHRGVGSRSDQGHSSGEQAPQEGERRDINCAVKEYLVSAGFKLTAMTFCDEVDQDLDSWQAGPGHVKDALKLYYRQFVNPAPAKGSDEKETSALMEEKRALETQLDGLNAEKDELLTSLQMAREEILARDQKVKGLEGALAEAKQESRRHEADAASLRKKLEEQRAEAERAALKAEEEVRDARLHARETEERLQKAEASLRSSASVGSEASTAAEQRGEGAAESGAQQSGRGADGVNPVNPVNAGVKELTQGQEASSDLLNGSKRSKHDEVDGKGGEEDEEEEEEEEVEAESARAGSKEEEAATDGRGRRKQEDAAVVRIVAESLPKIVPNVLINKREELLPLIMCAIERHPEPETRDSLTHGLFNLIKKPDEEQRRIIMDACVELASRVGEERTETELLPQCWEQISHKFAERRLLVAQSCGQLARYVGPAIRTSLILSIVQQLTDDPAPIVREAAARNLGILLPLFTDMDKYSKVEETVFRLVCDPAGEVVEESLGRLVPALVAWAKAGRHPLSQLLRSMLLRLIGTIQRCPPASGVEGSPESHLRVLGEGERWNVDVLLRMLTDLLPEVRYAAIKTCPAQLAAGGAGAGSGELSSPRTSQVSELFFSDELLDRYSRLGVDWPAFDWLPMDCLPTLLQLACMLQPREEALRSRLCKSALFASFHLPPGLRPDTATGERLARMCVLPILLAGVLGAPGAREGALGEFLRDLVYSTCVRLGAWSYRDTPDLVDAFRLLSTLEQHHPVLLVFLWELVVNPTPAVRSTASVLFHVLTPYIDTRSVTMQILPALVTLGSDPNVDVKYSSIAAFGAVAQHFKDDTIVEKIRVQMDTFLEDGSHEATVAVLRALTAAKRREVSDALCGAIRALDSSDMSPTSFRDLYVPAITTLLKDSEALDPLNRDFLENILKERAASNLFGKPIGKGFFGDGNFLSRNQSGSGELSSEGAAPPPPEESKLRKMMRTKYEEMMKGKNTKQLTALAHQGSR